jgi:hypothetical protein
MLALQAIEWMILGRFLTNFEFLSSVVVVAVGMWATPFALSIMSTAILGTRV